MNKIMSVAEIRAQFESEWILLKDPEVTGSLKVKGGIVLWHSKNRNEVYRKATELRLRPRHSAILYTNGLSSVKRNA